MSDEAQKKTRKSGITWFAIGTAVIAYQIWNMNRTGTIVTKIFPFFGAVALGGLWAALVKVPPEQTEFGTGGWWQYGVFLSALAGAVLGVIAVYRLTGFWF